ncbi:MAG: undecaprenyl/decaprenyl-phosphate alpha-N-acetylglucosaminyl 1-phosphate transferase [Clostridiales bacterium]|jgi:UDP-N-acetylmuramyl pentapeptide phosphotransferase/UDP-N-acetylglucosamine-1-phosphate transferase|nr:undecaprenyl/decaprenyl-phosphate alpha-N-acetylglucosaminyl 1-phosphate transferase [Clostridiales bacterium]
MNYFIAFCVSLIISLASAPWLIKLSNKLDFTDKPTKRKKHKNPTPLIGGVFMFIAFAIGYSIFVGFGDFKKIAVLAGAALILIIGLFDDFFKTRGREFYIFPRVLVQLFAASLVFFAGIRFWGIANPVTGEHIVFPIVIQYFVTILWIFGVTTVMNFSDGLDGVTGGITVTACVTFFICAILLKQPESAFMSIILIGAVAGFLKYNFFPAKVFMGDSGATTLGFLLAVMALYGAFKQATVVSVAAPVLALGIPIFDNVFVVMRRFVERKPIYKADATQIHHRLVGRGVQPAHAATFIILLSVCLNLTSVILLLIP